MKGHCAITEKSRFPVFVAKDAAEGYDKAGDPSGTPLGFMPISGHSIQQSMADRIVCLAPIAVDDGLVSLLDAAFADRLGIVGSVGEVVDVRNALRRAFCSRPSP